MHGLDLPGDEEYLALEALQDEGELILCKICHLPYQDDGSGGNTHLDCYDKQNHDLLAPSLEESTARGGTKGKSKSSKPSAPSGI
jgi:hypothetical protein